MALECYFCLHGNLSGTMLLDFWVKFLTWIAARVEIDWLLKPIISQPHRQWPWLRHCELSWATEGCSQQSCLSGMPLRAYQLSVVWYSEYCCQKLLMGPGLTPPPLLKVQSLPVEKCRGILSISLNSMGIFDRYLCTYWYPYISVSVSMHVWIDLNARWYV